MRALILFIYLIGAIGAKCAQTNYFCILCNKGPLSGRIWITTRGPICDQCMQSGNRCSICGLPIVAGDGSVQTADGRFICRFDKTNVVMDVAGARAVFAEARRKLVGVFGNSFALKYPAVTVNVFDVDYWTERNQSNNLHKSGFSSTRKAADGACVHTVVMWSGRPRDEMLATAAHEYTHLWINENRPEGTEMGENTEEAVCELAAYCLMGVEKKPEVQKRILASTYTQGKINTLVGIGQQKGMLYVLTQVKNGAFTNLEPVTLKPSLARLAAVNAASGLPTTLRFTGLSSFGTNRLATINGKVFAPGDRQFIRLHSRTAVVICREIRADAVLLDVDGSLKILKLEAP